MLAVTKDNEKTFCFFGIRTSIQGIDAEDLAADFDFYTNRPESLSQRGSISLTTSSDSPLPENLPASSASQVFSDCVLYRDGENYLYDYGGKAQLRLTRSKGRSFGRLESADRNLRLELGYLFLQSELGRHLDAIGLHRLHGFACVPKGAKGATLVLIPSGGGKSTLAFEFLKRREGLILSDDTPILDRRGFVYPFLHRLGATDPDKIPEAWRASAKKFERRKFGPKWVVPVNALPAGSLPRPEEKFPVAHIVIAERHGSLATPKISPLRRHKAAFPLLRDLVVGMGVPQIAELLLTRGLGSLPGLTPVAASRFAAASAALARARVWKLQLSRNNSLNLESLISINERA
jgi:hypothetical protein